MTYWQIFWSSWHFIFSCLLTFLGTEMLIINSWRHLWIFRCSLIIASTGKTIYENAEIHCQKGHTVTQYITTPLSFQFLCQSTVYFVVIPVMRKTNIFIICQSCCSYLSFNILPKWWLMYNTVVSNHFHSVKILLFSSARSRDFDGLIGIELPVSMYTTKTSIDLCRFNVRSST